MSRKDFRKPFIIYRANKSFTGNAFQWDFNPNKDAIFIEAAKQNDKNNKDGNATFNWKNKVIFMAGPQDIGEILAVLNREKNGAGPYSTKKRKYSGLYHANNNGDSILSFYRKDNDNCIINLSVRKNNETTRLKQTLGFGELSMLKILLNQAVLKIYKW